MIARLEEISSARRVLFREEEVSPADDPATTSRDGDLAPLLSATSATVVGSLRLNYEYVLIGIYTFFVGLFVVGLLFLLARKIGACCALAGDPGYRTIWNDDVDVGGDDCPPRHPEDPGGLADSDYENCSLDAGTADGETRSLFDDELPEYDPPPDYRAIQSI